MRSAFALRIVSGRTILNLGVQKRLRAFLNPIFTDGVVTENGICSAAFCESAALRLASSPSQSKPVGFASSPKVGALGSPRKIHLFAKASPFGRGVTAGDGEGEDADHVQQPYSKHSFHGAAAGRGREKAMGLAVSGCTKRSPALCRAMSPVNLLPYLPSP